MGHTADLLSRSFNILRLETLEASLRNIDISYECVQLVHRVLVLVPEPRQSDPHPEWDTSNTLGPDSLVQSGVNPDILSSHLLLSKLLNLLDSTRSAVLEANTMKTLVHINGVLPGHHLSHGGASLFVTTGRHLGDCLLKYK